MFYVWNTPDELFIRTICYQTNRNAKALINNILENSMINLIWKDSIVFKNVFDSLQNRKWNLTRN